jgi:hypothetical protein
LLAQSTAKKTGGPDYFFQNRCKVFLIQIVFGMPYFTSSRKTLFFPRCILARLVKRYTASRPKNGYNALETKFTA